MKLAVACSVLIAALLLACGYHTGLTAPEGVRTVGVEFFGNDGPLRDLEVQLQSEMAQAIERMLPVRIVDPTKADLIVRGRVLNKGYSRRGGIRSPDNKLLETGIRISVEATLVDPTRRYDSNGALLPPRVLRRAATTTDSGYRIEEPDGERAARARALRNMVDRLTLDLFGAVAYEPAEEAAQTQEPGSY